MYVLLNQTDDRSPDCRVAMTKAEFCDDQPRDHRKCECGRLERYAADPMYPIEFDERTNEYQIVYGGAQIPLQYCFRCGGRLPESTRDSLFTSPDENEMAEIADLFREAQTIDDVVRILGPPDEICEGNFDDADDVAADEMPANGGVIPWRQQFLYREKWESLDLFVHEHPDGRVSYFIAGKQISE